MTRSKILPVKPELRQLVDRKREREALEGPCPAYGQPPARMIRVDQATGLEDGTGKPPCPECRPRQDQYRPGAFNVVQVFLLDDPDEAA